MTNTATTERSTDTTAPALSLQRAMAEELIHFATLAPSGHNTQPWTFSASGNAIDVFPDLSRRLRVVDPDDHALYISLGCAVENLVIAAAARGFQATVSHLPDRVRVALLPTATGSDEDPLFRAIPERQTNRGKYNGQPIHDAHVRALIDASMGEGVDVRAFRPGTTDAGVMISFVEEANLAQFSDPAFVSELVSWIRFTRREAEATRDGLIARVLGFPWVPRWLGTLIMTRFVTPRGEATRQAKAMRSSAQLMLFIAAAHDRHHWVELGRSFERVALSATSLGIAHAHVNMPCEVEPIRRRLAERLELAEGAEPLLLIRLGYGTPMARAPRRPVEEVMRTL